MIKINLLPFRAARKKENVRRQISIFLLTVILIAGCVFYLNIHLSSKIDSLNSSVETTKKEVAKYEKISKEIERIEKQLKLLEKKMEVINSLEGNRKAAARLMEEMTQAIVPQRMWLSSFKQTGNRITVTGLAIDNKTVADFMTRLESMKQNGKPLYKKVEVASVLKKSIAGSTKEQKIDLKSFQVAFTRGQADTPQTKKAKK